MAAGDFEIGSLLGDDLPAMGEDAEEPAETELPTSPVVDAATRECARDVMAAFKNGDIEGLAKALALLKEI